MVDLEVLQHEPERTHRIDAVPSVVTDAAIADRDALMGDGNRVADARIDIEVGDHLPIGLRGDRAAPRQRNSRAFGRAHRRRGWSARLRGDEAETQKPPREW